jgi:hypothetical protein
MTAVEPLDLLDDVVSPVLRALTREGELEAVSVEHVDGEVQLEVTLRGEIFRTTLWSPSVEEAPADARDRLASDLQDFISESRFAGGDQRPWP